MKVRFVAVLAAVVALGLVARAEDAFKWDPKAKKPAPKVGDKWWSEIKDVQKNNLALSMDGNAMPERKEDSVFTYRATFEVLEVDGDEATKTKVTFDRFERKSGEKTDTSLQGKTVTVEGKGDAKKATISDDATVSPQAKAWVGREIARSDAKKDKDTEPFFPKEPVAADGEWKLDPEQIAKDILKGAKIDPAKSSATGKLTNVREEKDGHHGTIEVTAKLQVTSFPMGPGALPVTEGGLMDILVVEDRALDGASHDGHAKMKMDYTMKGGQKTQRGDMALSMDMHAEKNVKSGTGDAPAGEGDGEKK